MNILWQRTLKIIKNIFDTNSKEGPKPSTDLIELVEQARQEWLKAQYIYNTVLDDDLIDYASYLIQSTEKRYMYLLKLARQEGITENHNYLKSG